MSYQNVSPTEAKELLEGDAGAVYIDVRSIPEYEGGHPVGAFNIPIMQRHAAGMVPTSILFRSSRPILLRMPSCSSAASRGRAHARL